MGLKEVQEKVRKKKRIRRRRVMVLFLLLLLSGFGLFLAKSQMFSIEEVVLLGNVKIPINIISAELEGLKGQNVFLVRSGQIEDILSHQVYFEGMDIKRTLPDKLTITIREKEPEVNYKNGGTVSLLTRDGILLEVGANLLEDAVTLIDDVALPELGEYLYQENPDKSSLLEEFRYLQERNISETKFVVLDLRDMTKVKTLYKGIDIWLGYPDSLKEKLNRAINIIEGANLMEIKGYIDLSDFENPVVLTETAVESPAESIETPTADDSGN